MTSTLAARINLTGFQSAIIFGAVTTGLMLSPSPAAADNCSASYEYIRDSGANDLPQPLRAYRSLLQMCMDTLSLSNVKDAFILKSGAIAVVPRTDGMAATAGTLAQFCERFPRGTLHVIGRDELPQTKRIARAVGLSSAHATPCREISGGGG